MLITWHITPEQYRDMEMADKIFIVESYNVRSQKNTN